MSESDEDLIFSKLDFIRFIRRYMATRLFNFRMFFLRFACSFNFNVALRSKTLATRHCICFRFLARPIKLDQREKYS